MGKPIANQIRWSEKKYSMIEFAREFAKQLPVLVKIEEGHYGLQEIESLEKDMIIRIQAVLCQPRVVAIAFRENHISIPLNCPEKFTILGRRNTGQSYVLRDIVGNHKLPVTVRFASDGVKLHLPGSSTKLTFGDMKVIKTFDQKFLEGHSVMSTGVLHPIIHELPTHIPVSLCVAEGFLSGTAADWKTWMGKFKNTKSSTYLALTEVCREILMYDPNDVQDERCYDYIRPSFYFRLNHENLYTDIDRLKSSSTHSTVRLLDKTRSANPFSTSELTRRLTVARCDTGKVLPTEDPPSLPPRQSMRIPKNFMPMNPSTHPSNILTTGDPPPVPKRVNRISHQRSPEFIKSIESIPSDISQLSIAEVVDCLILLNMGKYAEIFHTNQVDGVMLCMLDEETLQEEFQMNRFNAQKLICFTNRGWRPKETTSFVVQKM